jgi:hypothetical protein
MIQRIATMSRKRLSNSPVHRTISRAATLAFYFDPDRGVLPRQAEIDLAGLTQVIAFMGQSGTLKPQLPAPERFVDLRYLKAAGLQ